MADLARTKLTAHPTPVGPVREHLRSLEDGGGVGVPRG